MEDKQRQWQEDVLGIATERFGRSLAQEMGKIRVEMSAMGADIRREMAAMGADIRGEMSAMGSDIRREMSAMGSDIRREMSEGLAKVRVEIAQMKADILKWCFLFWVGQVAAIAGLLAVMLRR